MIKLMIVDDEAIFREYMRTSFDFESYGFTICCEARNGKEALSLMATHDPDVVLTDINMPLMDGLQLSERLLALNPDLGIVLITGHSEFEYAKKAVKIGVSDYILKPFEKEELMLTLLKLKDHIYQTVETGDIHTKDQLKQSLMVSLLNQEMNPKLSLIEELKDYGLSKHSDQFVVATLSIDNIDERWQDPEEKMLWRFAVTNILNELMDNNKNHHSFYDYEGNIVSLIEVDDHIDTYDASYLTRLKTLINNYLGFSVTLGVGTVHPTIKGIRTSYQESIQALSAKFMLGTNKAIRYEDLGNKNQDMSFYNATTHEQLLHHLRRLDSDASIAMLESLFTEVKSRQLSKDYIHMIYMSMITILLSYIAQSGKPAEEILGKNFNPEKCLGDNKTIDQWNKAILELYTDTITFLSSHETSRSAAVASKACDYIHSNFQDNHLSVTDVATDQFINQTYLRSMFKEEMGFTVSDYITKIRMERSKELLGEKKYLLADIAEQVGYSDASYFSKSFKKFFGVSPSRYERSL